MQNHLNLFSSLPTLRTKRLTLRPVRMSDAADLYEYSKDPEVARHVLWDAHTSIHQTRSYLRFLIRQYRAGQPSTFVIVWNENRKAIGTIGFMWVQQENRSAEVGYSLSRAYWNRGIMTEALQAVLQFGFDTRNLIRKVESNRRKALILLGLQGAPGMGSWAVLSISSLLFPRDDVEIDFGEVSKRS